MLDEQSESRCPFPFLYSDSGERKFTYQSVTVFQMRFKCIHIYSLAAIYLWIWWSPLSRKGVHGPSVGPGFQQFCNSAISIAAIDLSECKLSNDVITYVILVFRKQVPSVQTTPPWRYNYSFPHGNKLMQTMIWLLRFPPVNVCTCIHVHALQPIRSDTVICGHPCTTVTNIQSSYLAVSWKVYLSTQMFSL